MFLLLFFTGDDDKMMMSRVLISITEYVYRNSGSRVEVTAAVVAAEKLKAFLMTINCQFPKT